MFAYLMIDDDGSLMGLYNDKVLAIRRLRAAWEDYDIVQMYDTPGETKFRIRRRAKIGENPNDTLIVTTVRIVALRIIEG